VKSRLRYGSAAPGAMKAMDALESYIETCSIELELQDLVKLRASQLNGCAYCVDMHSLDLRVNGETEQRLYALPVWQETPFFSERERAALLWTETLTLLAQTHAPDEVYEQVRPHFSDRELADLTMVIGTINVWNRFGVGFRSEPGHYHPKPRAKVEASAGSGD
jgi:AhpD family alkylhydroperoxidase